MTRSMIMAVALGALVAGACKKSNTTSANEAPKATENKQTPASDKAAAAASGDVGVTAGGIQHADTEGAAAVLANVKGTVEVRRVGETQWSGAKQDEKLYPGDLVRTGDDASATIAMADTSTVELAETSSIAIASRDGTADPASATAMLSGLARFSVTPRAPGEGPFRVYTSSGVILTKGTVYGVGVAASGETRVGVENGTVEVVGLAQMDATPVAVEKTSQVSMSADGTVGSPAWPADDWGTWRDETDAKVQLGAAIDAHGKAMTELNKQLVDGYAQLQTTADAAATFEASAATSAEKNDPAAYTAALPEGDAAIDASFSLSGRLEALTWAYASHAELATELYVRHPKDVEASWTVIAPSVDTAVLWPKRYEVTATAYFEPLRTQYYIHHPIGRMHAALVGITVPQFYAAVTPPAIDPAAVRAKAKFAFWTAPELTYTASSRAVWIAEPDASWHANVHAAIAPPRAKVAWYVRPATWKATAITGAQVTGNWTSKLTVGAPQPMADLHAMWKVPVGTKIKIAAPDMSAAAAARASWKAEGHMAGTMTAPDVDMHGKAVGEMHGKAMGEIHGKAAGAMDVHAPDVKGEVHAAVKVPEVHVQAPDVKAKADIAVGAGAHAAGDAKAAANTTAAAAGDASTKVQGAVKASVKAPEVKVQAPSVKVEGHAKAGFKLGH